MKRREFIKRVGTDDGGGFGLLRAACPGANERVGIGVIGFWTSRAHSYSQFSRSAEFTGGRRLRTSFSRGSRRRANSWARA